MKYKILFVDDEPANLRMLERLFRNHYEVLTAPSAAEGLDLLALHDVALIVSDQRMPAMTGLDFLKKAAEMRPQTVRVILTGYTDLETLVEAINSGVVYKYVSKPWSNADLQQTVTRAIQHYDALRTQYQLGAENVRLRETVRSSAVDIARTVSDLANSEFGRHAFRTAELAEELGKALDLSNAEQEELYLGGLFHQLSHAGNEQHQSVHAGSEGALEELERGLIRLNTIPALENILPLTESWVKHYDSMPEGEPLPVCSRILLVAHAYDQLSGSSDPIIGAKNSGVIEQLKAEAGSKFDPIVVEALADLVSGQARVLPSVSARQQAARID